MFQEFFETLRKQGLKVSLAEWITFQEALGKGLAGSNMTQFYYLGRSILVKKETEYDKYDKAFSSCFKNTTEGSELTEQMRRWLDKEELTDLAQEQEKDTMNKREQSKVVKDEVEADYKKKLEEQDDEHNGGCRWIGTVGKTSFGNGGGNIGGIRIAGKSGHQSAFSVIGDEKYRDFREDRVIDNRQFQMALRKLRQLSTRLDIPETELDINGTIDKTCGNGGMLHIVMQKPRKNAVKLLLLMDSGGTMIPYTNLLNEMFHSVHKSNHYKEVKVYYFHNCIYSKVYNTPECQNGDWIDTQWLFRNLSNDYKVIIVGDAAMAPEELYSDSGNYRGPNDGLSGFGWLTLIKKHFKKVVWMNPKMSLTYAPWREAETDIQELIPMYKLSVKGLNDGMTKLMERK